MIHEIVTFGRPCINRIYVHNMPNEETQLTVSICLELSFHQNFHLLELLVTLVRIKKTVTVEAYIENVKGHSLG